MYKVIKKYGHEEGLSCAFRQWRASHSHCRFLHGYALSFEFCFSSSNLNEMNWVIDYGGLKELKGWLKSKFDHKTIVAEDDPELKKFKELHKLGIICLNILPSVGCEALAKIAGEWCIENIQNNIFIEKASDVKLEYVRVSEHEGNSAMWEAPPREEYLRIEKPSVTINKGNTKAVKKTNKKESKVTIGGNTVPFNANSFYSKSPRCEYGAEVSAPKTTKSIAD